MRLYIAGPMRGYDQFNFPAFLYAAFRLRGMGFEVISPAEHDLEQGFDPTQNSLEGFDLAAAMEWDLAQIRLNVDAVVLLPGWEESVGANAEVAEANANSIPVYEYDDFIAENAA